MLEGGGGIRIVEPSVPQYFIDDWATMHRGENEDEAERISHQVAATGMKKKDESVPEGFKRTSQTYDLYFPESIKGPTICKLGQFGSSKEKTKLRVKTNFRVCASLVHTNIDKNGQEEKIYHGTPTCIGNWSLMARRSPLDSRRTRIRMMKPNSTSVCQR